MILYESNLNIFSSSLINKLKVFSGFGTKQLGDARRQIENIYRFFDSNDIQYKKIVIPEQIHSVNVEIFKNDTSDKMEKISDTDAVVTSLSGVILTVVTADCAPLIYSDNKNGVIAISHNGWRGTVKRMAQKVIDKMIEIGAKKESIRVAIGPSIGACCYDITDDRYYEFKSEFDGISEKIFHTWHGKKHLDISMLNYLLLIESGIDKDNIDHFPFCTKCDKNRFFSYRRDKKSEYGEMFSFIVKSV